MRLPYFTRPPLTIKPADMADAAVIAALHARSFAHGWSVSTLEAMLADRQVCAEVAVEHAVCGFILSKIALDEAEVLSVAVDPTRRKGGIGKRLLEAHMNELARRRITQLFLEVAVDNLAAVTLYKSEGFIEIGRRKSYYRTASGQSIDALTMRRDLSTLAIRPPVIVG